MMSMMERLPPRWAFVLQDREASRTRRLIRLAIPSTAAVFTRTPPSLHRQPAVNPQDLPRDEGGEIAREEQGHVGDLARLGRPLQG